MAANRIARRSTTLALKLLVLLRLVLLWVDMITGRTPDLVLHFDQITLDFEFFSIAQLLIKINEVNKDDGNDAVIERCSDPYKGKTRTGFRLNAGTLTRSSNNNGRITKTDNDRET